MNSSIKKILFSFALVLMSGFGCSEKKDSSEIVLTDIDSSVGIVAHVPENWNSMKFNTLYRNPKNQSGFSYVQGGVNYGFGVNEEKGELKIKVHVIAIPKSQVPTFEKAPFPASAIRKFETNEYVVYTALMGDIANDPDVISFLGTLGQKK